MRLFHGGDARLGLVPRIIPDKDGTLVNSLREFECFPFTLDPLGAILRLGGAVVSYRSVLSQRLAVCSTAPAALPCCRFGDSCLEMQVASARKGGSRPDAVTGWSTCVCAHIFSFHSRLSSLPGEEVLKASAHASPNEHKKNLANFLFRRCLLPSFEILGLYGI